MPSLIRARLAQRDDERGSLAPAVPIIALMLLMLAGLGIDGSRQLNARGEAVAYAEEAARAGAQAVDLDQLDLTLDQAEAIDRVQQYCAAVLKQPEVTECRFDGFDEDNGRKVVVKAYVATEIQPTLLGIVYPQPLHASGVGKARPYEGLDNAFADP